MSGQSAVRSICRSVGLSVDKFSGSLCLVVSLSLSLTGGLGFLQLHLDSDPRSTDTGIPVDSIPLSFTVPHTGHTRRIEPHVHSKNHSGGSHPNLDWVSTGTAGKKGTREYGNS